MQRNNPAGLKTLLHCALAMSLLCPAAGVRAQSTQARAVAGSLFEPDVLSADYLESSEAVIRDIRIANGDVFDPDDPDEDGFFHGLLNAAHIQTRPEVIRRQLLMNSGDVYSASEVEESARMLRDSAFLTDAEIRAIRYDAGYVDLEVRTADSWSLTPSFSFSRKGGKNTGGFRIEENNLLGWGSEVELGYKSGIDRDSTQLRYRDPQLGGSRVELGFAGSDNSDGSAFELLLDQPFYALDTRRALGFSAARFDQVDGFYELGEISDEVRHEGRHAETWYGWSDGLEDDFALRWTAGLGYDTHRYSEASGYPMPDDPLVGRHDVYPFIGVELLEDRYERTLNVDQIHRVEDRYLGLRVSARAGYASEVIGSDTSAWLLQLSAQRGFHPTGDSTLMLQGGYSARLAPGGDDQYLFEFGARFYQRQSERRLFHAQLTSAVGQAPDSDDVLTLGGDNGLRGYPIRYQNGNGQALLTLEQRFYTDWYPFHLFRVGAAVFFDAGRVWNPRGAGDTDLGLLRDAGVGLRIGSPLSANGRILHIDVAFPLDGPRELKGAQLLIETRKQF